MTTHHATAIELCTSGELRRLREAAGRTQFQAAYESGVGLATWRRWEHGGRPQPSKVGKLLSYVTRLKAETEGAV